MTPTLVSLFLVVACAAPEVAPDDAPAFHEGARVLAPGRVTVGLLAPTRVGLGAGVELAVTPWVMPVLPNASLRAEVIRQGPLTLSASLGAHLPTFPMRLVAREGALGLLPPDAKVPLLVSLEPGVSMGLALHPAFSFNLEVRGHWVYGADPALPVIELPYLLPRMAPYVSGYGVSGALALRGGLGLGFGWQASVEGFYSGAPGARWAVEPELALVYALAGHLRIRAGTRAFVGEMPQGLYVATPLPFIDVELGLDFRRSPSPT